MTIDDEYSVLNEIYERDEKIRKGVNDNMPKSIDYDNYNVPANESGMYFRPQDGKNRIRLVTKPMELRYWEEDSSTSRYATHILQDNEDPPEGKPVKVKYAYLLLDRMDNNKVKIYEASISVFRQIIAYATDKEYGNPTMYDLTMTREGTGKNTKYTVIASPVKEDLTDEEVKRVAEFKQLEDIYGATVEVAVKSK